MLQALGVSPDAESLYLQIAQQHSVPTQQLAKGRDPDELAAQLNQLRELGLVVDTGPGEVRALPLGDSARSLRDRRVAELDAAVTAAERMSLQLMESQDSDAGVEVLIGSEVANRTFAELCRHAQIEIAGFDRPPYMFTREPTLEYLQQESPEFQALERGVSVRSVYHPGFDMDRLSELSMFIEHGEHAKLGDVPMKLLLFDQRTAILPAPPGRTVDAEVKATVVRHPVVVNALASLFEAIWERSVSIRLADTGELQEDPRRDALVSLLMSGATDSAIASQFSVTERSVRRWIAELMDELKVQTRLQLGAALAKSQAFREDSRKLM